MQNIKQIQEEINQQIEFYKNNESNDESGSLKILNKALEILNETSFKNKIQDMSTKEAFNTLNKQLFTNVDVNDNNSLAKAIIDALGGSQNILDIDACITKLRLQVEDKSLVVEDTKWTSDFGAIGIVMGKDSKGKGMQVAYGPRADVLKNIMNEILGVD